MVRQKSRSLAQRRRFGAAQRNPVSGAVTTQINDLGMHGWRAGFRVALRGSGMMAMPIASVRMTISQPLD